MEPRLLLAAGAIDPTFGFDGYRVTDLGLTNDKVMATAIQDDGKVVVAGSISYGNSGGKPAPDGSANIDFAVARYNVDGSLDTTFGPDEKGFVTTDFGGGDIAYDILIQPDGKIVVGSRTQSEGKGAFAVLRCNDDGTLDETFGNGGTAIHGFGFNATARDMALAPDNSIVVAGYKQGSSDVDIVVARYLNDVPDSFDRRGWGTGENPFNLGAFSGLWRNPNLSIHESDDEDWFQFWVLGELTADHYARIKFEHDLGNLDLELYDSQRKLLSAARGVDDEEFISLAGLPPGPYYLRIFDAYEETNPRYELEINTHEMSFTDRFDQEDRNDTRDSFTDLGTIRGRDEQSELSIHLNDTDWDTDWYRFEIVEEGTSRSFVRAAPDRSTNRLNLVLTDSDGRVLQWADRSGYLSLDALPAGSYYVGVFVANDGSQPSYTLTVPAYTGQ
ncbi:MAG: hypothetical protein ACC645_02270 [Pirellulales bacterium]